MESERSSLDGQIKIVVKKKLLGDILHRKCAVNLIRRDENASRSICYITTALHIYANSIGILKDTLKNFTSGRGHISLNKKDFFCKCLFLTDLIKKPIQDDFCTDMYFSKLTTDGQTTIHKPDRTILSEEELFELFEKFVRLIFSNMKARDDIENFIKASSQFPYEELIGLCPKFSKGSLSDFEDPLEFFEFLCIATKPLRNKNDNSLALCTVTVNSYYQCTKCEFSWEEQPQKYQNINLLLMLQKK